MVANSKPEKMSETPEPEAEDTEVVPMLEPEAAPVEPEPDVDAVPVADPDPVPMTGDVVFVESVKYRDTRRNSVSVGLVQDVLTQRGFGAARRDLRGWFHDGTAEALGEFQSASGLPVTGEADSITLAALLASTGIDLA